VVNAASDIVITSRQPTDRTTAVTWWFSQRENQDFFFADLGGAAFSVLQ
jgi:hypothetical protein